MTTPGQPAVEQWLADRPAGDGDGTLRTYWGVSPLTAARRRLILAQRYADQLDRLDREFPNLQVSLAWLVRQARDPIANHLLIEYVQVLVAYLHQRGRDRDLRDLIRVVQGVDGIPQPPPLLLIAADAAVTLGEWTEAEGHIAAALAASRGTDLARYAQATLALGRLQLNRGQYTQARATLRQADQLLAAQGDRAGQATARAELAAYHLNRRQLDQALALYRAADRLSRQPGDPPPDRTLFMVGVVYRHKGDHGRAQDYLGALLQRAEARQDPALIATTEHHLAWLDLTRGHVTAAQRRCGRALALYRGTGDRRGEADALEQLGLIRLARRQPAAAVAVLTESLRLRQVIGNGHGVANSLRRLGIAYLVMGDYRTGGKYLARSLLRYHTLGVLTPGRLAAMAREVRAWLWGHPRGRGLDY